MSDHGGAASSGMVVVQTVQISVPQLQVTTCCWLPCCGEKADPDGPVASKRKRFLLQYINKVVDVLVVLVVQVPQVQFLDVVDVLFTAQVVVQFLDKVVGAPVVVQRQGDGPDSVFC